MAKHFRDDSGTTSAFEGRTDAHEAYSPSASLSSGAQAFDVITAADVEPERKRRGLARTVFGAVFGLVALVAIGAIVAMVMLNRSISLPEEDRGALQSLVSERTVRETAQTDAFYVLIVGNDSRDDDYSGRSDVLILARVEPSTATVTLVSVPRDTMVYLGDTGQVEKINAAYAYYGASAAIDAVSELAGVPISHFVRVNFTGVERVVDLLGGVRVNVPEAVSAGNGGKVIPAGEQVLDGETALAYARERYTVSGGDFGRAQAQRLIVSAIIRQVLQASPTELPGLVASLAECVSTDYSVPDLVGLALTFQGKDVTIYSAVAPSYGYWLDGVSYVGTMFDEWQDMMRRVDAGLDPNDESAQVPEPQASSTVLGAATNSAAPRDYQELAANAMTTDDVVEPE